MFIIDGIGNVFGLVFNSSVLYLIDNGLYFYVILGFMWFDIIDIRGMN